MTSLLEELRKLVVSPVTVVLASVQDIQAWISFTGLHFL